MDICVELPDFVINLKEGVADIYKLLKEIRPEWEESQIQIKAFSNGISSDIYRCFLNSTPDESFCVRMRRLTADIKDFSSSEILVVKELSAHGYFPPLPAVFKNGYCYEFITGKPLLCTKTATRFDMSQAMLRPIARQMANIHSVHVPGLDYSRTDYYDFVLGFLNTGTPCSDEYPSVEELKQEVKIIEELTSSVGSPLVLVHGDAHPGNFLWNEDEQKMTFVDWKLSRVAPRAVDIIHFFYILDGVGPYLRIPVIKPKDMQKHFCYYYLERWNELDAKSGLTQTELDRLYMELKYFKLVVMLMWTVTTYKSEISSEYTPDLKRAWDFNFSRYLEAKEEVLGIRRLGKPDVEMQTVVK